jgi:ABC-type dipeptide/oligopeptide/nickel transport system permease component
MNQPQIDQPQQEQEPIKRSWLVFMPLVVRRLAIAAPLLLGVSFIAFTILYFTDGDPVLIMLGEKANDPQLVEELREEMGLNDPFLVQYVRRIWGIITRFDFGTSWTNGEPVAKSLIHRFPATLELTVTALIISSIIGIIAGVLSALRRNSVLDYTAMTAALLGVSIPAFWLALMLIYFFAVKWQLFPISGRLPTGAPALTTVTGMITVDALLNGRPGVALTAMRHLFLPALTIGMINAALLTRMTRSSMLDTSVQDFVRTARAKGLNKFRVTWHMFRNALIPVVTILGLQAGTLLGGAIITETIFAWEGVGKYLVESIVNRDGNAVQGAVLLIAFMFIFVNTLVDIVYLLIDPRIRLSGGRA